MGTFFTAAILLLIVVLIIISMLKKRKLHICTGCSAHCARFQNTAKPLRQESKAPLEKTGKVMHT